MADAALDEAAVVMGYLSESLQIIRRLSEADVNRAAAEKENEGGDDNGKLQSRVKDWGRATALLEEGSKSVKTLSDLADTNGQKLELANLQMETWKVRAEDAGYRPSKEEGGKFSIADQASNIKELSQARTRGMENKLKELQNEASAYRHHMHKLRETLMDKESELSRYKLEARTSTRRAEESAREVRRLQDLAAPALADIERLKRELGAERDRAKKLTRDFENLKAGKAALKDHAMLGANTQVLQLEVREKQIEELQEDLKAEREKHAAEIAYWKKKIEVLTAEKGTLEHGMAELHEQLGENARLAAQADAALKGAADLKLAADEHARMLEMKSKAGAGGAAGMGAGKKGDRGKENDGEVQALKKTIRRLEAELESTRTNFDGLLAGQGKSDRSMLGMIEQGQLENQDILRRKQSVVEVPVLIPGGSDMVAGFEKVLGLVEAMDDSKAPNKVDDADVDVDVAPSREAEGDDKARKMRSRLEEATKILGRVWMLAKKSGWGGSASGDGGGGSEVQGGGEAGGDAGLSDLSAGEGGVAGAGGGMGAEGMLASALKFHDSVVHGWFKGKTEGFKGDGGATMLRTEIERGRVIPMGTGGKMLSVLLQWIENFLKKKLVDSGAIDVASLMMSQSEEQHHGEDDGEEMRKGRGGGEDGVNGGVGGGTRGGRNGDGEDDAGADGKGRSRRKKTEAEEEEEDAMRARWLAWLADLERRAAEKKAKFLSKSKWYKANEKRKILLCMAAFARAFDIDMTQGDGKGMEEAITTSLNMPNANAPPKSPLPRTSSPPESPRPPSSPRPPHHSSSSRPPAAPRRAVTTAAPAPAAQWSAVPTAHPPAAPMSHAASDLAARALRGYTAPVESIQRERPHGSMTVLDLSDAGYHGGAIPVHQHQQYPPGGPVWGPQNWDAENAQATRTSSPPYVYTQGGLVIQGKSQGTFLPPIDPPRWAGGESGEPLLIQIDGL